MKLDGGPLILPLHWVLGSLQWTLGNHIDWLHYSEQKNRNQYVFKGACYL